VQPSPKKQFLAAVAESARPYRPAWRVGASGLVRRFDSGYWGHVWFFDHVTADPGPCYQAGLTAGVVSPYLLRTFNGRDPERAPTRNFIAVHAWLTWDAPVVRFDPAAEQTSTPAVPAFSAEARHDRRFTDLFVELGETNVSAWLAGVFGLLVPRLTEMAQDESLLGWLSEEEPRSTAELRYAALLAHHLRMDDQVTVLLRRAAEVRGREDRDAEARGVDLSYRSDRQTTYPQDWSPERFERFLRAAPRD
jgi:hypothetical protein